MDIIKTLAQELEVNVWQVEAAVKLIDDGNTIPFISRYRKEATGSLNDEILRGLFERLNYLRNLEEKKAQVLATIQEQGKLTPELKKQIETLQQQNAEQQKAHEAEQYRHDKPRRRAADKHLSAAEAAFYTLDEHLDFID